ncbi:MAG: ABC transporter ATP-binding protein [Deltaproteobacteria bacterium]|nr:ABC transporter ATP-binding protein [Deltaproteobacteria bacterium]
MGVEVKNLSKEFNTAQGVHVAVKGVSFEVEEGSLSALLGPSGSGKSTVLRMIAGLETPDSGEVFLNGEAVCHLPPQKRGVGFVFQNYALFKHLKVSENISFGLKLKKVPAEEAQARVEELLVLFGLAGLGERYPHQLSGGQRQRVALARALAPKPKVLLLDEPFGAVDAKIREELRDWLRKLHEDIHVTSLMVTHDQEEALEICDKIVVMNQGLIEQVGKPEEIYNTPASEFVAHFVGSMNIVETKAKAKQVNVGPYRFETEKFDDIEKGDPVKLFFRPQDIYLSSNLKIYRSHGTIERVSFLGINMKVELKSEEGFRFFAIIPQYIFQREGFKEGQVVSYHIEEMSYLNLREGGEIKKFTVSNYL